MTYEKCKTRLFSSKQNFEIDDQINEFIEREDCQIIDIKFSSLLDTYHNIIMFFALVIYKEKESE